MSACLSLSRGGHAYSNIILKSAFVEGKLNFAHINLGTFKKHKHEVEQLICKTNLDILAVSETWFNDSINLNKVNIDGYTLYRHDRKRKDVGKGGGVALFIKSSFRVKVLARSRANALTEFLFVEMQNLSIPIICGVVYNPPKKCALGPLGKVLSRMISVNCEAIILGDFNINPNDTSLHARTLEQVFNCAGFSCLNTLPTNFSSISNPSMIDLLWSNATSNVIKFAQISLESLSTHDLIFGVYNCDTTLSADDRAVKYIRDFEAVTGESLVTAAALQNWNSIYELPNIDDQVTVLNMNLNELIESTVPIKKLWQPKGPQLLRDPELDRLISDRNFFHAKSRTDGNIAMRSFHRQTFIKLRNKVTARKNHLLKLKLSREFSPSIPTKHLWRNLKKRGIIRDRNSQSSIFRAEELNNYFSSVFTKPSGKHKHFSNRDGDFDFETVTDYDILLAINRITTRAIGLDGVPASILKKLCPFILPFITYIINNCITKSYFPLEWKKAVVKPIPKVASPSALADYRPISILPALSKILERILEMQIKHIVSHNNFLFENQSGFREKHSTVTAMLKVVDDLGGNFENNLSTLLVMLDFKKAFDLVPHNKLVEKLYDQFTFSSRACALIESYLSERQQCVKVDEEISSLCFVTSGTPQGGILSALLFTLFINDMSSVVDCELHLYADDGQVYCSGPRDDPNALSSAMNATLKRIESWAATNGVVVNPAKSQAIFFDARTKLGGRGRPPEPVVICNDLIPFVKSAKSLGLILSDSLSWDPHISKVCGQAFGTLAMLRQSQFILSRTLKTHLIKTLILPKLLYCSNVFIGMPGTLWEKLRVCFNACVRFIFNLSSRVSITPYVRLVLEGSLLDYASTHALACLKKLLLTQEPKYLFDKLVFPRLQRANQLSIPRNTHNLRKASFFIAVPRMWNELQPETRRINSMQLFKSECMARRAVQRM